MATSAATAAAAMAARARREIREHFERNYAFDPGHAVSYEAPDSMHQRQFDALVGRGIILDTGSGRYWLDKEAERREEERRQAAASLVLKLVLVGTAIGIAAVSIVRALN